MKKQEDLAIYIHQWEFTDFLLQHPDILVKDMSSMTKEVAYLQGIHECDCCGEKWADDEIIIKIMT